MKEEPMNVLGYNLPSFSGLLFASLNLVTILYLQACPIIGTYGKSKLVCQFAPNNKDKGYQGNLTYFCLLAEEKE